MTIISRGLMNLIANIYPIHCCQEYQISLGQKRSLLRFWVYWELAD